MIEFTIIIVIAIILYHDLFLQNRKINRLSLDKSRLEQELKDKNEELIKVENIDPLTDILNRNRLDIELQMEFARSRRSKKTIGISLIGIDNLKEVNEKLSHSIGDYLLKEIATLIKSKIRSVDLFGRWWGDKFLIIYSDIELDDLKNHTEKLKNEIEEYNFVRVGSITTSFGLTLSKESDDEVVIIERAEKALKIAKKKGKNYIEIL
ncbi:GGDEF domain-containing protein [Thiospirochaeta perfilievii]|uniref:diguanylate cyclase n=1 Tax=Thiospirochaeta perfilievii TaxID=252967 RepID=A0A5C1QAX8_9SPIO|nr:GGDEF domain-containing protein [Thiospirochaeta perfilievii]QEN04508.1 GGDEF domain-containing protein [Thiospirochaeta perfilievii]